MSDWLSPEKFFSKYIHWVDRVAATVCRRHGVRDSAAEDSAAWVKMKLLEDDYALLRKLRDESELKVYLATAVPRQLHEYLRERKERWRPSKAAERLGPPAPELESLVSRDGYGLQEAGKKLRTAGRTTLSDAELARLLAQLPVRVQQCPVEVVERSLVNTASQIYTDAEVGVSAEKAHRDGLLAVLAQAMGRLEPEELMIARLHFGDRRTLAEVARALGLEQKPLYRRVDLLRKRLRESLAEVRVHDFGRSGILGPDGLPITEEELQGSRIITDISSANAKILKMIRQDPNSVYNLSPRQFEELVAELLHKQGYEIVLTPPSKDGGFDMYAARKDGLGEFLYLVECKRYAPARPVGVEIVRALYGVVQKQQATAGIIVASSHFTKGAAEFQQSVRHQLSLRDYLHLQQWLAETLIESPSARH